MNCSRAGAHLGPDQQGGVAAPRRRFSRTVRRPSPTAAANDCRESAGEGTGRPLSDYARAGRRSATLLARKHIEFLYSRLEVTGTFAKVGGSSGDVGAPGNARSRIRTLTFPQRCFRRSRNSFHRCHALSQSVFGSRTGVLRRRHDRGIDHPPWKPRECANGTRSFHQAIHGRYAPKRRRSRATGTGPCRSPGRPCQRGLSHVGLGRSGGSFQARQCPQSG
jgi:hypothetical protein